ncbi:MAG: S8 family serine peptidase, partial [Acidobacteriota bacterium]
MKGMGRITRGGRSPIVVAVVLSLTCLALPAASAAGPEKEKLSRDLRGRIRALGADDLVSVIVQTRGEPSAAHLARLHGRGGQIRWRHATVQGYTARIPASQIEAFAEDPEIERVSHDTPVRAHLDVAIRAVRADAASVETTGLDGSGVGVAVIDSGVQGHPDLLRRRGEPQIVEVEIVGSERGLADYYGHGTHVAGIIAGSGEASSDRFSFRTFRGAAPGARLVSLRALAPDGSGYTSDVIAAIDWVVLNKDAYGIRVLNLSLGHPVYESYTTDPLCRAVRGAWEAGIVVVVSAGNDGAIGSGYGTITSPGNEPSVITVGAMDDSDTATITDDVLAWYSSKGPTLIDHVVKPDIVAPGSRIVSARAIDSYLDTQYHHLTLKVDEYKDKPGRADKDGDYYELAGTSMAAPMVAAAAALMIQSEPALTPDTVKARLMKSAAKDDLPIFDTGAGYLDIAAALQATGQVDAAPSPRAILLGNGIVVIENTGLIWGTEWTLGLIWGTGGAGSSCPFVMSAADFENDQITESGLIWGTACGDEQLSGSGLIWGTACGDEQLSGSGLIWGTACGD